MNVELVPWDDPEAAALRSGQRREIAERYGTPDSEPGTPPSAADIAVFAVVRDGADRAVGCGGLRDLGEGAGEVKRMYVLPEHRGSGAAAVLLNALEEWARDRGWKCLRLETGDRQPDAVRFYTRSGYTPVPAFGAYADSPGSLCFERTL
ncbi:N-acetyltransferase [Nocardiopsis terrae]|uniref:GNAT superfamily N-acetyltransferase n=1 Tax=Nocardiopsis terrae TaxID=372655 RepID=A0ABR9HFZ1_9ACTN|nr:GNAT family N-acetyltransferase [Nocardiopsis terrae]MBE1457959.1 GNAT superfamily N-acetyltransferase [Nocardiopsis terrae]GHC83315.1 N-acetyltransferase [Nocardiopsis terrae]